MEAPQIETEIREVTRRLDELLNLVTNPDGSKIARCLVALQPENAHAWYRLGSHLADLQRHHEAKGAYVEAGLCSDDSSMFFNAGQRADALGHHHQYATLMEIAGHLCSVDAKAGGSDRETEFDDRDAANYLVSAAERYVLLGRLGRARELARRAHSLCPDDDDLREFSDQLEETRG